MCAEVSWAVASMITVAVLALVAHHAVDAWERVMLARLQKENEE